MRRVIITGADGFVGSHTAARFLREGCEVLALDLGAEPRRLRAQPGLTYMRCDISDTAAMLKQIPRGVYDTAVHFAWAGSAGPARGDYSLQLKNAQNTVEFMRAAKELGCSRFVCAGSVMEYEAEAAVHARGGRPGTGCIYGLGKLMAHGMCKALAADIGMELVWPVLTNAYGAGELSPRFVNSALRRLLRGERLELTAGTQNYDFVYVTDAAGAFYLIAKNGRPFCEYVIGSGNARPLREFVLEMAEACPPGAELRFGAVPFAGIDLPPEAFDISSTRADCGFEPEISFARGVRMTVDWLKTV